MRTTATLLIVLLLAPAALAEDAKSVFESLFASKIKAAGATADRADDVALAKDMVALAKTSATQPGLVALLCEAAYDLGSRHADGFGAAAEAMALLAETVEAQRPAARDKLITILTRQSTLGKPDDREPAGEALVDLLLTIGDEKVEAKQYAEAVNDYRRAVAVATQKKSASLDEAKAKLEFAVTRDRTMKQLARLQEKLLKDADPATAEEIVKLYVIELDDPEAAKEYLNRVKDEQLKALVPLAAKAVEDVSEEDALKLGEWYRTQAEAVDRSGRITILRRAQTYYGRFLQLHTAPDLSRTAALARSADIVEAIKRLTPAVSPRPLRTPAPTYLSDLTERQSSTVKNVPFAKGGQFKVAEVTHEIVVARKRSEHGLALHPPPKGESMVSYDLAKPYRLFRGGIAINDSSPGTRTPLTFRIIGDGEELWRSKPTTASGVVEAFEVKIEGVKKLQLTVSCLGTNEWAFAVWIDPALIQ